MTELYGEKRAEALRVIDDDDKFDLFMQRMDKELNNSGNSSKHKTALEKAGEKRIPVSKEEFFKRLGTEHDKSSATSQ